MSEEESIQLAREASGLMQNPAFSKAFAELEAHYVRVWKESQPSQHELREEAYGMLFALGQFRRQLQTFLETGKILTAATENETS